MLKDMCSIRNLTICKRSLKYIKKKREEKEGERKEKEGLGKGEGR